MAEYNPRALQAEQAAITKEIEQLDLRLEELQARLLEVTRQMLDGYLATTLGTHETC